MLEDDKLYHLLTLKSALELTRLMNGTKFRDCEVLIFQQAPWTGFNDKRGMSLLDMTWRIIDSIRTCPDEVMMMRLKPSIRSLHDVLREFAKTILHFFSWYRDSRPKKQR